MEVKNPSFEIAGLGPGQAQDWAETQTGPAEDIGVFDGGAVLGSVPFECFEAEWGDNHLSAWVLTAAMVSPGMFEYGTEPQETFETSWVEPAAPTSPPVWNHHARWGFLASDLDAALFDVGLGTPEAYEDFEAYWLDNDAASWMWPGGALFSFNTEAGPRGPFAVILGDTLSVSIDGAPAVTITFVAGATTAVGIAAAIAALLAGCRVWSTALGRIGLASNAPWGTIQVTGGTANAALQFPTGAPATSATGSFDVGTPENGEDFEEEWMDNETYDVGFAPFGGGTLGFALFDGGSLPYESFDGVAWTETFA